MKTCPQCGGDTEKLHEGYCEVCCYYNQQALDDHNRDYDRWRRMQDSERDYEIKKASGD